MFKFVIILVLVIFLFGRLFKFLMKYAFIGVAHKYASKNFNKTTNTDNSNISGNRKAGTFDKGKKAGDYIDFEIVK